MKFILFPFLLSVGIVLYAHAQQKDFIRVNFSKADSVASLYPLHSLRDLRALSDKLTMPLSSDVEKFRAIFRWVCSNITNDYDMFSMNKRKRETLSGDDLVSWNKSFSSVIFRRLLNDHTTVCTGYAYLVRELALHAGLSCEMIHGYGRNAQTNVGEQGMANHTWNAVRLNGKWYLCDATWASGVVDARQRTFVRRYNDAYFLASPKLFIRNHYPLKGEWKLIDEDTTGQEFATSLEDFLNGPIIYAAAIKNGLRPDRPSRLETHAKKNDTIKFVFRSDSHTLPKVSLMIGSQRIQMHSSTKSDTGEVWYQSDHVFRRKGVFALYVMSGEDFLYSYRVVVD